MRKLDKRGKGKMRKLDKRGIGKMRTLDQRGKRETEMQKGIQPYMPQKKAIALAEAGLEEVVLLLDRTLVRIVEQEQEQDPHIAVEVKVVLIFVFHATVNIEFKGF